MLWAYTVFFGSRLVTIVSTAILARLLVPADFGLIGYALLLLNFVEATRDLGIKDALIYSSDRLEDTADTAFYLNVALGLFQYALAFLLAPLAMNFMDDPRLVPMLRVMALVFIFNSVANTHDGLLQKDLEFRKRYTPDVYSAVIKGVVSIVMALLGYGVWSLAAGHVVGSVVRMVGKWMLQPWRPRLRFFPDRARALWDYGVHILLFSLLGIALDQADQMFIGTLLGEIQLGYYTIAARIPEMVLINFSLVLTMVLFPTYARIKDDTEKLTRGFLLTAKYTSFVALPVGLGLVAVAPELVEVVFGSQWQPAIIMMQVLALLAMTLTLPWPVGDVFKALGRPDISTKLLVIESLYTFPLVALFTLGSRLAVMASLANLISAMITTMLRLGLASRFLKLNPMEYYFVFRGGFFGGIVMFGAVVAWRAIMPELSPLLYLLTTIPIGALVYGVVLWLLEKEDMLEALEVLLGALSRKSEVAAEPLE
ncbi:MAG: lipopolysaccharide biosynthesis protein [Anaerolineae bacterium]|nr:lipopolysaccharide biosynthesis protein [Anaerolineae bacterium]